MPLKVVAGRHGSKSLYIRGTHLGVRVDESARTGNRRTAEIIRSRREAEIENRVILGRAASATFAQAVSVYVELGRDARFLFKLLHYFGETKLAEIDQAAVLKAAKALYPNAAPATIDRQVITPVSAVYQVAVTDGLAEPRRFRRLGHDRRRLRWLTPEEAERLLAAIESPRFAALVGFLLGTGARPSEAFRLEIPELYLDTREAWFDQTKTDQPRMIHYPARTAELLAGVDLPEVGAVFRTPKGAPYVVRKNTGGQIEGAFRKAREAAGLGPDVTPYILRHTWATWFYAQTRDFGALMDLGGWAKADTANRYRKIAPADLGDRLAAHGWRFGEDAAPPKKTGDVGEIRGDREGDRETLRVFRGLRRS